METKKCIRCHRELEIDLFGKDKSCSDGHSRYCKQCMSEYNKSEKRKAYKREYKKSEKSKALSLKRHQKYRKHLANVYILHLLESKRSEVPPELIELKRSQLKIIREIRNQ